MCKKGEKKKLSEFFPLKTSSSATVFLLHNYSPTSASLRAPPQHSKGTANRLKPVPLCHLCLCCWSPVYLHMGWQAWDLVLGSQTPHRAEPGRVKVAGLACWFTPRFYTSLANPQPHCLQAGEEKSQPALCLTHHHSCWISH